MVLPSRWYYEQARSNLVVCSSRYSRTWDEYEVRNVNGSRVYTRTGVHICSNYNPVEDFHAFAVPSQSTKLHF